MKSSASRPNEADSYWHWADCLTQRPFCLRLMVDPSFFLAWKEQQTKKGDGFYQGLFSTRLMALRRCLCLCVCVFFPFVSKAGALSAERDWAPAEVPFTFVSAPHQWGMGTRLGTAGHFLHIDSMSHWSACNALWEEKQNKESKRAQYILSFYSTSGTAEGPSFRETTKVNILVILHSHMFYLSSLYLKYFAVSICLQLFQMHHLKPSSFVEECVIKMLSLHKETLNNAISAPLSLCF